VHLAPTIINFFQNAFSHGPGELRILRRKMALLLRLSIFADKTCAVLGPLKNSM
jgi:hypothetical protein